MPIHDVTLTRFAYSPMGTFGKLKMIGFACYTCERPWHNNEPNISCIPVGEYWLEKVMHYGGDGVGGNRDYWAYAVKNVPGRSHIHIHIGNHIGHSQGCILLGRQLGWLNDMWAVAQSGVTFERFMDEMRKLTQPRLIIRNIEAGVMT